MKTFPYSTEIGEDEIKDMLYQISLHTTKVWVKKFNNLNEDAKKKVTAILRKRAKICRKSDLELDNSIIVEVISCAEKGIFITNE